MWVFLVVTGWGCAPGPKLEAYRKPTLDDSQVAVLKGYGGTYVTVIDNQKAPGARLPISNWGGNTVRLTPGQHDLTVSRITGSGYSSSTVTHPVTHTFEAGHKYKIGPQSLFNPFNVTFLIKDTTAGTETAVAGDGLNEESDEEGTSPVSPVPHNPQARGPSYDGMDVNGHRVEIEFDDNGAPLATFDGQWPTGFLIAGRDQVFHPAQAVIISDNAVVVWNDAVSMPVAVRLGSETNLGNRKGGKAVTFRTDKWLAQKDQ